MSLALNKFRALPIALRSAGTGLVGGAAALSGGMWAFEYGVTRDYVMGLEVVLANIKDAFDPKGIFNPGKIC